MIFSGSENPLIRTFKQEQLQKFQQRYQPNFPYPLFGLSSNNGLGGLGGFGGGNPFGSGLASFGGSSSPFGSGVAGVGGLRNVPGLNGFNTNYADAPTINGFTGGSPYAVSDHWDLTWDYFHMVVLLVGIQLITIINLWVD